MRRPPSLGWGNPAAVADLQEGERVLDLGSGGGIDVLFSAKRVGPTVRAFGLDMTDEMVALAQRNASDAGATNAEFLRGTIDATRCRATRSTSSSATASSMRLVPSCPRPSPHFAGPMGAAAERTWL